MTELPTEAADEAERLTRLARTAADENERDTYRDERARLLSEYGFTARVREDNTATGGGVVRETQSVSRDDETASPSRTTTREGDAGNVLVCYPSEWVEEGEIRTERIEDTARAVERRLSGAGNPDDWEAVAAHNERVAEKVADSHGAVHGENARAFADFMSNHYARRVESATEEEIEEFRTEYFVRNAWPTDEQRAVVENSLSLVFDVAEAIDETAE